ncbi:MAG: alpha/beta hydrolase [Pseudomonadota bacterium]
MDKTVSGNGIEIRTEHFGNEHDEPMLLVMGATAPGVFWQDNLIGRLLDVGYFVVRYDNRDTGRSTCFDFAKAPYTLDDMAADAIAVLDGYGIERTNVAGASMGGMIVQLLMIHYPERLKSATVIMSSPMSGGGETPELASDDLPGPDPAWMEQLLELAMNPPTDRDSAIEQKVAQYGMLAGSAEPYNADVVRKIAAIEFDQARDLTAAANHSLAIGASSPSDRRPLLRQTSTPALVVHGTEDPILPHPHGVALAEAIPGAELLTLDRGGHDMPECYLDEMIAKMVALRA